MKRLKWVWAIYLALSLSNGLSAEESTVFQANTGQAVSAVLQLQSGETLVAIDGGLAAPLPADRIWQRAGRRVVLVVAGDGSQRWLVVEVNGEDVGSPVSPESRDLYLDLSPPTASFKIAGPRIDGPQGLRLSPTSVVSATLDDPSGVVESQLRDATRQVPASQGLTDFASSTRKVTAWAVDAAGNKGSAGSIEFEVDADGPVIDWIITDEGVLGDHGTRVYQPPVRVRVSAADTGAGVASVQAIDADNVRVLENGASIEIQTGSTIFFEAVDGLGNKTRIQAAWELDQEGPQIKLLIGDQPHSGSRLIRLPTGGRLAIEVRDDGAGVETAEYRYNHRQWLRVPETIQFVDRGSYVLEVRASDRFGNTSELRHKVRTSRLIRPEQGVEQ